MAWKNESRRHALASKGVKTGTKGKPVMKVPLKKDYFSIMEEIGKEESKMEKGDYKKLQELYGQKIVARIEYEKSMNKKINAYNNIR